MLEDGQRMPTARMRIDHLTMPASAYIDQDAKEIQSALSLLFVDWNRG